MSPNAFKNRPQKSNKKLIKGTPSQDPSKGGFWEGSGWIWRAFWEGFGGICEPRGVQMEMKNDFIRGESMSFPQDPSREALGRVLGGFGEVWGRFWDGLEGFCAFFLIDFKVLGGI